MDIKTYTRLANAYHDAIGEPLDRIRLALQAENPDTQGPEIAALIDCEGIPWDHVGQELEQFRQHSEKARLEAQEAKDRQEAIRAAELAKIQIEAVTKALEADCPLDERGLQDTLAALPDLTAQILKPKTAAPYSFASYINEITSYKPGEDFRPDLFNRLPFPKGTTSYIGARTGRGKSASLINLAREALEAGKRVQFVTLELSRGQLMDRLILSKQAKLHGRMNEDSIVRNLPPHCKDQEGKLEVYPALRHWIGQIHNEQRHLPGMPGNKLQAPAGLRESIAYISQAMETGLLLIDDVRGLPLDRILSTIQAAGADVVLIDYIQKLPSVEGGPDDSYARLQRVSQQVIDLSVKTGGIFIAAAQFNRTGSAPGQDDTFTDGSFRESGDLEQDAHNAVGIGWKADKQGRFYEVLKARESHHTGQAHEITFNGGQCFMERGKHYNAPQYQATPKTAKGSGDKKPAPAVGGRDAE